ncbi:FMN-binding negative transcriptional regulator [Shimia sp.]|uniref:FMN-binding negative transcriptional regulator n=1 Tax=Shimia sp. TaxID=1954381 RepID=UPI003299B7D8
MHPNPAFRAETRDTNLAFARERGFGMLTMSGPDAPLVSHIPFIQSQDGTMADLHLVRSNPMAREISAGTPVRLVVSGPDAYVSPDWYGVADQVPTWNYVAVHLIGTIAPLPDDMLPDLLDRLSAQFEALLLPKPPWTRGKMSTDAFERMLRMIRPFRLQISDVQGTWKLGQNKPPEARKSAAMHMSAGPVGADVRVLANLMQSPISEPEQGNE